MKREREREREGEREREREGERVRERERERGIAKHLHACMVVFLDADNCTSAITDLWHVDGCVLGTN